MGKRLRLLLIPIVLGLGLVLALLVVGARHREEAAAQLSFIGQDNTVLHAAKSLFEIDLVREAVLLEMQRRPDDPSGEVVKRFDILWNTISVARSGDLRKRFERFDKDQVLDHAQEVLERYAPMVDAWDPADRQAHFAFLADFADLATQFRDLMNDADTAEQRALFSSYDSLIAQRMLGNIAAIVGATVSLLVGVVALMMVRAERRRAIEVTSHARAAAAAAESRARFLTMVSHELRTPMNGVLGLLELLRASELDSHQAKLAAHVAVSAQEMLLVIEALLLLSEIRDGVCRIEAEETSAFAVAREAERRLAPFSLAGRPPARVTVAAGAAFRGDPARLSQAVAYLLHYVGGALGVMDSFCSLGGAPGGGLLIRIDLGAREGLRWDIETIFADGEKRRREIGADAIGPAAGRELLDLMGSRYSVEEGPDGRFAALIVVPSAAGGYAAGPEASPLVVAGEEAPPVSRRAA